MVDFSPAGIGFDPKGYALDGTAVFATDSQLLVKFFKHPQLSRFKSDKAGTPIFDDVEMVSVIQPGEKEEIKVLATDFHRRRFPNQYKNFTDGISQRASGTPLETLFPSEPSTIMTLNAYNIFTVQQLSTITDSAMIQLPMGRSLVDRARAYLSSAHSGQNFHAMMAQMQETIAQLKARLGDESPTEIKPMNLQEEEMPAVTALPSDQSPRKRGRKSNAEKAALAAQNP